MSRAKNPSHRKRCQAYKNASRRELNKKRKLLKHLVKYPNDKVAEIAYNKI